MSGRAPFTRLCRQRPGADFGFQALLLPLLLAAAPLARADETFPVLKAGDEVYSNVTVFKVTSTDIYFTYPHGRGAGMANLKLKNLDPEIQKHFHYDATNAASAEKKQKAADTVYRRTQVQPTRPPAGGPGPAQPADAAVESTKALWRTDLPGALSQAGTEHKMVLLDFTGSDWCPWCIKFDQEVLSTSQFAAWADANLVLVKLDFPRSTPQSDDLRRANEELSERFNVDGYPTFILLNAAGRELGRQVGYREGGPGAFIAELEKYSGG